MKIKKLGKINAFFCNLYGKSIYLDSEVNSALGKVSLHFIPQSLNPSLNTAFQRKRNSRFPPWGLWNKGDESTCISVRVAVCVLIEVDTRKLDQMAVLNPLAKWHAHMKTKKAWTLTVCSRKKCTTRTINSLVSYYPTKYLFKVSPYVDTWHMLQLVFRSYLTSVILNHLTIGIIPI